MAFREVRVFDVREVLRLWLGNVEVPRCDGQGGCGDHAALVVS